jgi:SAM-dependent methyltransferase
MTATTGGHPAAPWWERFFDDRYRLSDLDRQSEPTTRDQVDCVLTTLGLSPGDRVLDLGCGTGRHAVLLAEHGLAVTGVDFNPDYLELARERARAHGVRLDLVRADMRDLSAMPQGAFDAVISMYTSFGFFPRSDGDQAVLRQVRRTLAPGGALFLDVINRDWLLRSFAPSDFAQERDRFVIRDYDDRGGQVVLHEDAFDPLDSTLRWTITRQTEPTGKVVADYRVYSVHELLGLLGPAGLRCRQVLGDYHSAPFTVFAPRIICIAERADP